MREETGARDRLEEAGAWTQRRAHRDAVWRPLDCAVDRRVEATIRDKFGNAVVGSVWLAVGPSQLDAVGVDERSCTCQSRRCLVLLFWSNKMKNNGIKSECLRRHLGASPRLCGAHHCAGHGLLLLCLVAAGAHDVAPVSSSYALASSRARDVA